MIKKVHSHEDGKVCYTTDERHMKDIGLYLFNGQQVLVGFNYYCGMWFAYDPDTGEEVATFKRRFFEQHFANMKLTQLVADPNCKA